MERILSGVFIFGTIGLFTVIGVLALGVGWFLYFFLILFRATSSIIVLGKAGTLHLLITFPVGFPTAKLMIKNSAWYENAVRELAGGAR
ncbi:hypothetical protein [Syntrophus aciditrophicus]|uniref:Hypothetical membrane protein n=1 Tax=Syntrophus aciditrophicus (strain SB) TaxID=56780 RepID=Q2LVC1_SYNAS|nr:hypothetical protein [Syntrophus aciditrophicus]ABC78034.1 hypothetical membrane protein [Syntrophus aciditrophicus SB]